MALIFIIEFIDKKERKKYPKAFMLGFMFTNMIIVAVTMFRLHPYEYVYFNELVGGLNGAQGNYEMDYWGASYSEASAWLKGEKFSKVYSCNLSYAMQYKSQGKYQMVGSSAESDFIVCDYENDKRLNYKGDIMYEIKRFNVPLNITLFMIIKNWKEASNLLIHRKIGVIPTDTVYGISCLALEKDLVEQVYRIKQRDFNKPFIILISSIEDLRKFSINLTSDEKTRLTKSWPGPVSIILTVNDEKYQYLHRGTKSIAFRLPKYIDLVSLLEITGPLVSTSANISSERPARAAAEAVEMFGNTLDFYLDVGILNNPPSKIIKIVDGRELVLRP
jgi:L-threonylcarbamoyladenylate synthase